MFAPDEEKAILEESPDFVRPIITFAVNTGMRLGEIVNLKWSDVDRRSGQITSVFVDTPQVPVRELQPKVESYTERVCEERPEVRPAWAVPAPGSRACGSAGRPRPRRPRAGARAASPLAVTRVSKID